jgi:hypothetical protein
VNPTTDAPTQQIPTVRNPIVQGSQPLGDPRGGVPLHVLEATRAGLVDLEDAPRRITGAAPPVPVLGRTF